ncbi:hypothetical protein J5N97_029809 [Dioscorea zingiberensis]|uniref:Uncharacterized protein n=1 Tax=Dioscorea zingiberensis TaxID=325984 RepID=A0A9D5H3N1_9LILI|nr:hypothetical protein J5N97_029809 [Dioscorea zingiberensis]
MERRDQVEDEERRHLRGRGIVLPVWPTVDGPLGLSPEESVAYARRFFRWGFALLPWLRAVNCIYFYVLRSAIGFTIFTVLLFIWALTFMSDDKPLFGSVWDDLVIDNNADKLGLTGWS